MRIRFFLADWIPLRMACGTSLALPQPKPTTAADGSPTTTSAAKDMFLPPLTTLVTRLIETTWSFSWKLLASSFFFTVGIPLISPDFPNCHPERGRLATESKDLLLEL